METRKKTNYSIIVVLSTLILFLSAVGVSCGAKKPSPKPADEPKSKQMTRKKTDQFLQRVEKNNPKGRRGEQHRFAEMGPRRGGRGRGGRFAEMGPRRGGRGRGGRFAQMGQRQGGRGRGGQFGQMGWHRGGRGRDDWLGRGERPRPEESDIWGDDD